ncbi:MAG: hypothetical protein II277_06825 [Bacteroidales bacterium]|nr:hypothetical protein [Bacteroidales bacterium]
MTTEKLTESIELEDYCLLKGYSIVYNRWVDAVVLSRDGIDYKFKDDVTDEKVFEAVRDIPMDDTLADMLEEVEYPDDEIQ